MPAPFSPEREFLRAEFKGYYEKNAPDYPYMVEQREFGFGVEKKIDFRHKRFGTNDELRNYLITNVPFYVSYSVARYAAPEAKPMASKMMLGSDLVFDIDVHGCTQHDDKFICNECLGRAKEQVVRLIEEFLIPDLGIAKKEIAINFSGNRGYHVHVLDARYLDLDGKARLELVNYLNGVGLDAGIFCEQSPKVDSPAWFGRIARCIQKRLENGEIKTSKRKEYLDDIVFGIWGNIRESTWFHREFDKCRDICRANVDEQVTTDVSRLIRLPGTIHGESTLIAKRADDIGRFDPLRDAVFISDEEMEVEVSSAPAIEMCGRTFEPINNKKATLPKYYAAYLIGKGAARIAR
ncbi:MAG: DNA primase catalytic subunit PriS [Candidatus Micrarchaeota archaeon]|nr:DNA primase catalytic subunit PriS [Candidatus Micrarchaeota archaeon]